MKALKVSKIEARLDSDPEVQKYVHKVEIEKIIVGPTEDISAVNVLFGKLINPIIDKLRMRGALRTFRGSNSTITSYNILLAQQSLNKDEKSMHNMMTAVREIIRARDLLRENGMGMCRTVLRDFMTNPSNKRGYSQHILQSDEYMNLWNAVVGTQDVGNIHPTPSQLKMNNPKLSKLEEILKEFFERARASNKSSRAIVFSQWRDSVEEIVNVLSASKPLICPNKFVGQGSRSPTEKGKSNEKHPSSKVTGMNQKEQQRVIREFRDGLHNVLVCTW